MTFTSKIGEIANSPDSPAIINIQFANIKIFPRLQTIELLTYLPSRPLQAIVRIHEVYQPLKRIEKVTIVAFMIFT